MGFKVLIVEDEPHMAGLLRQALTEEGHATTVANTGVDGLSLAADGSFDVLLLDAMLPGIDGWTLLKRLRSSGSRIPVLMVTARDTAADMIKGLDLGADDYLVKPFSLDVLLARVRALGRRGPAPRSVLLEVADLTLHQGTRDVMRSGRRIALTRKEYAILELLMRETPRVVTYDALLQTVWGSEADIELNTVTVFMRLLRTKIEMDGEPRLLHTVRGVGYVVREHP
jgi:two-component system copper resistance phosphate regulon response regulator CusR